MVGQMLSNRPSFRLGQGPDDGLGNGFSGVGIGNAAGHFGSLNRRLQAQADQQESCGGGSKHGRVEIPR